MENIYTKTKFKISINTKIERHIKRRIKNDKNFKTKT